MKLMGKKATPCSKVLLLRRLSGKAVRDTIDLENYQTGSHGLQHVMKEAQHQCVSVAVSRVSPHLA